MEINCGLTSENYDYFGKSCRQESKAMMVLESRMAPDFIFFSSDAKVSMCTLRNSSSSGLLGPAVSSSAQ